MKNPGCLRKILIGVILSVSISSALVYFTFSKGMYKGEPQDFDAIFIENGTVFTGLDEEPQVQNILVRKGSISCIGKGCEIPENAKVIDATNLSVLPSLIDLGVQFYRASGEDRNSSSFDQFLSFTRQRPEVRKNLHLAGITTIRSVGDAPQNILVLRDQLLEGKLSGPRLYAAGLMITVPNGYPVAQAYQGNDFMLQNGVYLIEGEKDVDACMESLVDQEVDGLKIVYKSFGGKLPTLSFEEMQRLIQKGNERNLWSSVLTGNNRELQAAIQAGAQTIELGLAEEIDSTSLGLLVESRAAYLPMLSSLEEDKEALTLQQQNVKKLHEQGARIGVATDNKAYQSFGKSLQRELELLFEAGIPAKEVLRMASIEAAISLKTDDRFGSLEEGKWADILICKGKPWENISDIKQVQYVIQEGRLVVDQGKVVD